MQEYKNSDARTFVEYYESEADSFASYTAGQMRFIRSLKKPENIEILKDMFLTMSTEATEGDRETNFLINVSEAMDRLLEKKE